MSALPFVTSYVLAAECEEHEDSHHAGARDALLRRDALALELEARGYRPGTGFHVRTINLDTVDVDSSGEIDWDAVCPRCGALQGPDELVCTGCGITWQELEAAGTRAQL